MNARFDYALDYKNLDLRKHPELYRIGKGEQGVLLVEPYKSELLPHWRFRNEEVARASGQKLYECFEAYLAAGDFIGADMARKFIQMGYTRARRYTNHKGGRKYSRNPQLEPDREKEKAARKKYLLPYATQPDPEKAAAAAVFYEFWQQAKAHPEYQRLMALHRARYEQPARPESKPAK